MVIHFVTPPIGSVTKTVSETRFKAYKRYRKVNSEGVFVTKWTIVFKTPLYQNEKTPTSISV